MRSITENSVRSISLYSANKQINKKQSLKAKNKITERFTKQKSNSILKEHRETDAPVSFVSMQVLNPRETEQERNSYGRQSCRDQHNRRGA